MTQKAKVLGWLTIGVSCLLMVEAFSFVVVKYVPQVQRFLYTPPSATQQDYDTYLVERDPKVGWPSASWLRDLTDERGARISPAHQSIGETRPCISLYGDSFAFSDEVEHSDAWANVAAADLGCRVDNYGVGGYGTDQAFLRLETHLDEGRDLGDVVILTLYPVNLNRNVNQWRHLIAPSPFGLKPAFYPTDSGVELSPLFSGDFEAFQRMSENPVAFLPAETYAPGQSGFRRPIEASFPYTETFIRIVIGQLGQIRSLRTGGNMNQINYPSYYDSKEGMSDDKRVVLEHILARFEEHCDAIPSACAFLLIPSPELVFQTETKGSHELGRWLSGNLKIVQFLDATELFATTDEICGALTNPDDCAGHFNSQGYARLADFVVRSLDDVLQSNR